MPQFKAQVPDPLGEHLPKLLAAGGVRTPAVRLLFLIFITQNALECSPVQVEIHHIGRGERALWQGRKEQFVDHLATRGADRGSGGAHGMRGDDHPCAGACWGQKHIRAVKECARGARFGMYGLLIRWLGQAGLHLRQIEEIVVLASHHIAEACQICHDGPIAILAIQPQHGLVQGKRLGFPIRTDRLHRPLEFSSVIAVACPSKGADPLMCMGLEHGCTGAHNLSPLAPLIARCADLV